MSYRDINQRHAVVRTLGDLGDPRASRGTRVRAATTVAGATAAAIGLGIAGFAGGADAVNAIAASGAVHQVAAVVGPSAWAAEVPPMVVAGVTLLGVGFGGPSRKERVSCIGFLRRVRAGSAALALGFGSTAAVALGTGSGHLGHDLANVAIVGASTAVATTVAKRGLGIGLSKQERRGLHAPAPASEVESGRPSAALPGE